MKPETISAKELIDEQVKIAKKRGSKYRNVKTVVDGITFDSRKEAKRYQELKLMERAGEISCLRTQHKFEIKINEEKICSYIADFTYTGRSRGLDWYWIPVYEDVKSPITRKNPVYRIKKKLMKAIYDIDIVEV